MHNNSFVVNCDSKLHKLSTIILHINVLPRLLVNERSNQQALGIIVFAYPSGVSVVSVLMLLTELQPLFDGVVTIKFTDDLCSVNAPSLLVCMED